MLVLEIEIFLNFNIFFEIWLILLCLIGILNRLEEIYLLNKGMN